MHPVDATQRFVALQQKLLEYYGARATSKFLDLKAPAMRVHALEAGEGESVVLFHGGDGEGVNWAPIMGPLQTKFRLLAVDRPGFGLSDASDDYFRIAFHPLAGHKSACGKLILSFP